MRSIVILEAFAKYLHQADPQSSAEEILARWLWERLSVPPESNIDRVLHCELALLRSGYEGRGALSLYSGRKGVVYVFAPLSESGRRLLKSLHQYSLSYEQQKWSRWVHYIKASDFRHIDGRS